MNYNMGLYRELEFKSVSEGMNINTPSCIHMTHIIWLISVQSMFLALVVVTSLMLKRSN